MEDSESGKRTVKMTEKAAAEQITKLKNARDKLSRLTSLENEIKTLMEDDANVDIVMNKVRVDFSGTQKEFTKTNDELGRLLTEQERKDDQDTSFEPKIKQQNEFFWECEEWMKEVAQRTEQATKSAQQMMSADGGSAVVSVTSKKSLRSQTGSTHSVMLKIETDHAALQAKAAGLRAKLDLEQEEAEWLARKQYKEAQQQAEERCRGAQLQAEEMRFQAEQKGRKERLAMETALAESDAKMRVLQKYELMVDKTQPEMIFSKTEQPDESKWVPIPVPPPQASPSPPQAKPRLNTQPHASPAAPLVASQATPQAEPIGTNASASQGEIKDRLELYSLSKAISQQANVTEYLIKTHKASLLPELTIPTFTGDPLEYNTFIRSIEHGIEDRTSDNRDRLQFLLQYTKGQPHELVKSCVHMEPTKGYVKAKEMLKRFFGDDFKIAEAYMSAALEWQTIKPEDGAALQSFALFLISCSNTMTDISSMDELDLASNIRALANKLPYKLKEAWRRYACDLQDKINRRAKFNDFVDFINKQVKYVLHPLYGNIKDNTAGPKELHQQRSKYRKERTPKSQKVFTTEVICPKVKVQQAAAKTITMDAKSQPCGYCNGEHHSLSECRELRRKPHSEKIDF